MRLLRLLAKGRGASRRMLDGFMDSLVQMFENCRPGLSEQKLASGSEVERFFLELYEKEQTRLVQSLELLEAHLSPDQRRDFFERIDERIRKVVIPGYTRLAATFTRKERNDFYVLQEPLHGVERLGWTTFGTALGALAVWAPFIPIWEKEWILPFAIAGLFFPNLRRYFTIRRYQSELNGLVARADDEIWRMDLAYMTDGLERREGTGAHKASGPKRDSGVRNGPRVKEGGR
jgi:hypothetical protein